MGGVEGRGGLDGRGNRQYMAGKTQAQPGGMSPSPPPPPPPHPPAFSLSLPLSLLLCLSIFGLKIGLNGAAVCAWMVAKPLSLVRQPEKGGQAGRRARQRGPSSAMDSNEDQKT